MARVNGKNSAVMEIEGDQFLIKRLSAIGRIAREEGMGGLRDAAEAVAAGARARAPEKTGELVDSIRVLEPRNDARGGGFDVVAGPVLNKNGEDYAIMMHEGRPFDDPQGIPYNLGTAKDGSRSEAKNAGRAPHAADGVGMKFLERAFESEYRKAMRRIERRIKAAFSGLAGGFRR